MFEPRRLVKNGEERFANTREELVALRFEGWREAPMPELAAGAPVAPDTPEVVEPAGTSLDLSEDEGADDESGEES